MSTAEDVVAELHRRQQDHYSGGDSAPLAELLAPDVVWHVPGTSPIAGEHRGREAVLAYFERRRAIAAATMRMTVRATLASDDDVVVQRVDGEATIAGERVAWRTVGVYRVAGGRVAAAWLVPLEPEWFDRVWTPHRA